MKFSAAGEQLNSKVIALINPLHLSPCLPLNIAERVSREKSYQRNLVQPVLMNDVLVNFHAPLAQRREGAAQVAMAGDQHFCLVPSRSLLHVLLNTFMPTFHAKCTTKCV